jgi:hypothetical protein
MVNLLAKKDWHGLAVFKIILKNLILYIIQKIKIFLIRNEVLYNGIKQFKIC